MYPFYLGNQCFLIYRTFIPLKFSGFHVKIFCRILPHINSLRSRRRNSWNTWFRVVPLRAWRTFLSQQYFDQICIKSFICSVDTCNSLASVLHVKSLYYRHIYCWKYSIRRLNRIEWLTFKHTLFNFIASSKLKVVRNRVISPNCMQKTLSPSCGLLT